MVAQENKDLNFMYEWTDPKTKVLHIFHSKKDKEIWIAEDKIRKLKDLKMQILASNQELITNEIVSSLMPDEIMKLENKNLLNNLMDDAMVIYHLSRGGKPIGQSEQDDMEYFRNNMLNPMEFPKAYDLLKLPKSYNDDINDTEEKEERFISPIAAISEVEGLAPEHYFHVRDILESMGFMRSIPLNDKWMIHLKNQVVPTWKMIDVETLRPMEVKNVTIEFAIKVCLKDLFLKGDEWRVISDGQWHEARFTDKEEEAFEVML